MAKLKQTFPTSADYYVEEDVEPKGRKCGNRRPSGPPHVKCRLPKEHPGEHWYYENMCCGVPIYQDQWR